MTHRFRFELIGLALLALTIIQTVLALTFPRADSPPADAGEERVRLAIARGVATDIDRAIANVRDEATSIAAMSLVALAVETRSPGLVGEIEVEAQRRIPVLDELIVVDSEYRPIGLSPLHDHLAERLDTADASGDPARGASRARIVVREPVYDGEGVRQIGTIILWIRFAELLSVPALPDPGSTLSVRSTDGAVLVGPGAEASTATIDVPPPESGAAPLRDEGAHTIRNGEVTAREVFATSTALPVIVVVSSTGTAPIAGDGLSGLAWFAIATGVLTAAAFAAEAGRRVFAGRRRRTQLDIVS